MATTIRSFRPDDAPQLANIVQRGLREINSRDYAADIIDNMCSHFAPERFIELAADRHIYVAVVDDRIVGTVSRDANKVYTLFVDPDMTGQGIGRQLMRHVEMVAAQEGHDYVEAGASITAHQFYLASGYHDIRATETEFGTNYIVRKPTKGRRPTGH